MLDLGILAWARVGGEDVEERHLATFGRGFRRIGSYVKLAQVGAQSCLSQVDVTGARVGVYMGSGLGNTEISVPLAEGILHAEKPWVSPMGFAGSVGNAAAFYVARSLGVDGPNVTVSQEELSFEAALLEGALAIREGAVDLALVGGVDVCEHTRLDEHRARLDAVDLEGEPTAGAGWVLLGRGAASARLEEVWIGLGEVEPSAGAWVLPGWRLPGMERAERRLMAVAAAVRIVEVLDGTERVPRPGRVTHLQRTRRGTVGRIVVGLGGA